MPQPRPSLVFARGFPLAALLAALLVAIQACSSPTQPTPDEQAPSLSCPLPVSVTSPTGNPVSVAYQPPAASGGKRPVVVTCTPASGDTFPVGSTVVVCRAVDAASRPADCSFTVTVAPPPRLQRDLFMAFGDSLTEGKPGALGALVEFPGAYPRELERMLRDRYTAQEPTVVNEAVGGESAVKGLLRFPGVLALHQPEVVLIMDGANDIARSDGDLYVQAAADAIEEMVRLSQESGAVVFLATLPPQRPGALRAKGEPFVRLLNEHLRFIAEQTGATLVDVYAAFGGEASTELVDDDGLHLTTAGYLLVAETFFKGIQAQLEVQPAS